MHAAAGIKGRYRIFLFVETAAAAASQRGKLYQETISKSISLAENKKCAAEKRCGAPYTISNYLYKYIITVQYILTNCILLHNISKYLVYILIKNFTVLMLIIW